MTTPQTTTLLNELQTTFGHGMPWTPKDGEDSGTYWETRAFILLWWPVMGQRDSTLSGIWDERRANQASPVVLLSPADESDKVRVVGPQNRQPVRELPSHRVIELLDESRDKPVRDAASFLSREFSRVEEAAVPGINVKDLLTPHFVRDRLLWQDSKGNLEDAIRGANIPRDGAWQPLFRALGFADERLKRGYLLRHGDAPVAVVHPYADTQQFSRLTEKGELPEGLVLADCESHGARWGILTAQGRHRVFFRDPPVGAATGQYFEINVGELRPEHRLYLGLLSPQSLEAGGWLTDWVREAKDFGEELRRGLEERLIKDALPNIARGLGEYREFQGADLTDRDELRQIEEAALTLVFRFMFLLHTEARGYLPVNSPSYRPYSATTLADDCRQHLEAVSRQSTARWDSLRRLVRMVRNGEPTVGVPAYNGSLFASEGFPGSALLESAEVNDSYLAPALAAIGFDTTKNDSPGLDYAGLDVGHLGAIYEKLLSYRLTRAPEDLAYDSRRDFFRPPLAGEQPEITRAQLYYQAEAGGRKAGGVYYTRREFVDHLLNHSLVPALEDHLQTIEELAKRDPTEAARKLFDFSVVDPAMGSAHFLTVALDKMADRIEVFLANIGGLPAIRQQLSELTQEPVAGTQQPDDGDLLRRLILKRCIYGVDISPMAVEVANITLWLASFVPGLSLSWLGSNLKCGDALIGVADPSVMLKEGKSPMLTGRPVEDAMERAAKLQQQLAENPDRTPEEVKRSEQLAEGLRGATVGLRTAFDMWAAEPLGLAGARHALETSVEAIISQDQPKMAVIANEIAGSSDIVKQYGFFHWPLEFPSVFHRNRPGFDVVVGNPPWDKIKFEKPSFITIHDPGFRGVRSGIERDEREARLFAERPELRQEMENIQQRIQNQRKFFRPSNGYTIQGSGDTDLYKLFCERYGSIARTRGQIGVVLPRVAFLNDGSRGFRRWFFRECRPTRIDSLQNSGRWAFDMEERYTIALVTAEIGRQGIGQVWLTGPARNESEFQENSSDTGIAINLEDLASWTPTPADDELKEPTWELPLLPSTKHVDVLAKIRRGIRVDQYKAPRAKKSFLGPVAALHLVPYTELHEGQQRGLFTHPQGDGRIPVWKGRTFDQYDPFDPVNPKKREPAGYGEPLEILEFVYRKRLRSRLFSEIYPRELLEDVKTHPVHSERIAFRDSTRATDSRTVRACLIPADSPLTHTAPYFLTFAWSELAKVSLLGIMNSIEFDWVARRYVENHLTYFVLNGLTLPPPQDTPWQRIGTLAAELSCVDERFKDFAEKVGVEWGPLTEAVRNEKRAEIDALVAHAYGLTVDELQFIFKDFTENAVPTSYRELVTAKFEGL